MRPEWTGLVDTIQVGAEWLLTSKQPRKAMLSHLGLGNPVGGTLYVSFAPNGRLGGESEQGRSKKRLRDAVVIFQLADHEWYNHEADEHGPEVPVFTAEEIAEFRSLLEEHGLPVRDEWNGAGYRSGSFAIASSQISASLVNAVGNYHEGCPVHKHPFCGGWQAHGDDEKACTWSASFDLLVPPAFNPVPSPGPPQSGR